MRRIALVAILLAVTIAPVSPAAGAPDFSGTWVLDPASAVDARAGAANAPPKKVEIVVRQTGTTLSIDRKSGDRIETAVHHLDGTESVNKLPSGKEKKSTSTWVGSTLVITSSTDMGTSTVPSTEIFSLSPNGRVMTIDVTLRTPGREIKRKLIYNKQ